MNHYYGVTRSGETLSHYGVKGMKWGVRKAILTGNQRALDRHYRKAAKKLAKLTDIGVNSKKYAAKSAAYGAAAAGTGMLTGGGTILASRLLRKIAPKMAFNVGQKIGKSDRLTPVSEIVENWGKRDTIIKPAGTKIIKKTKTKYILPDGKTTYSNNPLATKITETVDAKVPTQAKKISNNTLFRIGAGAVTAGLAAKSAQNAYRASHGAKYRAKAKAWKNEMDSTFKGTQYEGRYDRPKRRRRKG